MRKDFILDEKQIDESVFYGASAILLIARILEKKQLESLYQYATKLGLEVLVEVHNKIEAERAVDIGAKLIGINTRDLDTFQIHPELIRELVEFLPLSVIKIAESGIKNNRDYRQTKKYTDFMLIGTYFMETSDIEKSFHELLTV